MSDTKTLHLPATKVLASGHIADIELVDAPGWDNLPLGANFDDELSTAPWGEVSAIRDVDDWPLRYFDGVRYEIDDRRRLTIDPPADEFHPSRCDLSVLDDEDDDSDAPPIAA